MARDRSEEVRYVPAIAYSTGNLLLHRSGSERLLCRPIDSGRTFIRQQNLWQSSRVSRLTVVGFEIDTFIACKEHVDTLPYSRVYSRKVCLKVCVELLLRLLDSLNLAPQALELCKVKILQLTLSQFHLLEPIHSFPMGLTRLYQLCLGCSPCIFNAGVCASLGAFFELLRSRLHLFNGFVDFLTKAVS